MGSCNRGIPIKCEPSFLVNLTNAWLDICTLREVRDFLGTFLQDLFRGPGLETLSHLEGAHVLGELSILYVAPYPVDYIAVIFGS